MGLFGRGKGGGLMNVIRCDQENYLIWKWRPLDQEVNSTSRENAIRYGSTLRVKDGEVAVFLYKQKNGIMQDFIEGPYDDTIKTANFPVLASIVGLAFGGESPFQAEVFFINLQGSNQVKIGIPYFDVADPRFPDYPVPVAVRGSLTFGLSDYRNFIKLNRMANFTLDAFYKQIQDAIIRRVKGIVTNIPFDLGMPIVQLERRIDDVSAVLEEKLRQRLAEFGVDMKSIDINAIEIDKESEAYATLKELTVDISTNTLRKQAELNLKNMDQMQALNTENLTETMRIQREEMQRAQKLQTENNFIGAHALNQQTSVLHNAVNNLGQMGTMNLGGGNMNPAGMMTGMMMSGAVGSQMAGMMNNMGQQMQNAMNTPPVIPGSTTPPPMPGAATPPIPNVQFMVAVGGQQMGPLDLMQLQQMVTMGQMNAQTYVWRQGMAQWELAGNVPELASLFAAPAPPVPPIPNGGPTPPPLP
jgi:hypothetical protein